MSGAEQVAPALAVDPASGTRADSRSIPEKAVPARPVEQAETPGPRTYQCLWRWHEDGSALLQTAEEWLAEEAEVEAKLDAADDTDDGPSRGGILAAIAKEIAALRRERTLWAESHTALTSEVARLTTDCNTAADNFDMMTKTWGDERERAEKAESEVARLTEDAERLDWLEAEHRRVDPVAALTVKRFYRRDGSEWANALGVRDEIDHARANATGGAE